MCRLVLVNQNAEAGIADVWRRDFVIRTGKTGAVNSQDLVVVGSVRVGGSSVIVSSADLSSRNFSEQCFCVRRRAAQNLILGDWRVAGISLRPRQVNDLSDAPLRDRRHSRRFGVREDIGWIFIG